MRHAFVPGLVLGTSLAMGLLTALPVAAGASPASASDPKVLAVATNVAVKITHDTYGVVSTLPLPSGHWMVVAKVNLTGASDKVPVAPTACALSVGSYIDQSGATPATLSEGHSETLLLTASDNLAAPNAAQITCKTTAPFGSVRAKTTHIMAYRMGTLSIGSLGGSYTTAGSGSPQGIWGWATGGPTLPSGGSSTTIGSLPLTAGRWWIIAKTWVQNGAASSRNVLCGLYADGNDIVHVSMGAHNDSLDQRTVSLENTVSVASSTQATLDCSASGAGVDTSWVEMVAIRVGTLTTAELGFSSQTQGSGTPRVIEGRRDASQYVTTSTSLELVGQVALPAGRWAVVATGTIRNGQSGYVTVECELEVGAAHDRVEADMWHFSNTSQSVNMQLLVALPAASHAAVACHQNGTHHQVEMDNLRIVAMRTR